MNKNGLCVFPSNLDVQVGSFFNVNKHGKKEFCITKGYIIPVLRVERPVVLEKQDVIDVSVWKMKFKKGLEDGCFREHTNLTLVLHNEQLARIQVYLGFMKIVPFPKLEHLYLECLHSYYLFSVGGQAIKKALLDQLVRDGSFPALQDITIKCMHYVEC